MMSRLFIVLDAGPLSDAVRPARHPIGIRVRAWIESLEKAGAIVVIPEIADYEVRRKLVHLRLAAAIDRLDRLVEHLAFEEIKPRATFRRAAELWGTLRLGGVPTAHPEALDADCLLAAQASLLGDPGDHISIATTNVRHLSRFPGIDAKEWDKIAP